MIKYNILSKLLVFTFLIQSTFSYSAAAVKDNKNISNINIAATGSAITESLTSLQSEFKESKTNLKPKTLPKKTPRKAQQGNSIYDNKTYTHADAFDEMNIYHGIDVSYHNKTIDWELSVLILNLLKI